jgi:hypothetical protein
MSTQSETYLDVVGRAERGWPRAYDENGAIYRPCTNCGAQPWEMCTNPIRNKPRKTPCVVRVTGPWN